MPSKPEPSASPYIKAPNGDLIGNNYVVPKGDFGKFLGYNPPTQQELAGQKPLSGSRVIELALQKEMAQIGMGATKNGNSYRNIHIAWGRFNNEPGRERDMIKDGLDSIKMGAEKNTMENKIGRLAQAMQKGPSATSLPTAQNATMAQAAETAQKPVMSAAVQPYMDQFKSIQSQSHNDNVKYLEMQYKFQEISKQEGVISNLMKTRHETVSRTIRGSQG